MDTLEVTTESTNTFSTHFIIKKNQANIRIFDDRVEIYKKEEDKTYSFELYETSAQFIKYLRKTSIPTFVLKKNNRLLYCVFEKSMRNLKFSYSNLSEKHACATNYTTCQRLRALPEEYGGCSKVLIMTSGIEDFSWITEGYETFNFVNTANGVERTNDCFIVLKCEHYSKENPIPKKTKETKRSTKTK